MATNELGMTVPAGGDPFDPQGDMVTMADSLRSKVVVPVANTTERDALTAAISWTPTAEEPLRVSRGDADPGRELEYTIDGTTWSALMVARAETVEDVTITTGAYSATAGVGTATLIAAADYDRVVEVEVILNSGGVSAGKSWWTVLTRTTTAIGSDVEAQVRWAFSSGEAIGGSCNFTVSFDLAAGATARPRLWLDEQVDGGTNTLGGYQRFRIRVRPKF